MNTFTPRTFSIPELKGISHKTIGEHIKLYEGYVANANTVLAKVEEMAKDAEANTYAINEVMRRFSFEWNGMKNHEKYFALFEGGATPLAVGSPLEEAIKNTWGAFDAFLAKFKALALTRGIGWAMLSRDREGKLFMHWVDEQHLGQLQDTTPVVALDMWEHSFVADYQPSGKKQYVEDFFANINWKVAEQFFTE
ncbi:MAG: superoxide dismutase [Candidatus Pacebacteria bacterium]|nr:superoxide dismutase [Candidatus Paceibacterota bacterium]MBP9851671.1 superoxide dismutase [Candidatus Paceibacterota bacterium]